MTRIVTLKVAEEDLRRLDGIAHRQGITRSDLLRKGIARLLAWEGRADASHLVESATEAMLAGSRNAADWDSVEKALRKARRPQPLERIMSDARGRKWQAD
jgi:hypothetical protein